MKQNLLRSFLLFAFFTFYVLPAIAQDPSRVFDTLRFEKADKKGYSYQVSNSSVTKVGYEAAPMKDCTDSHFSVGGGITRGLFTLVTGMSSESSKAVKWLLSSTITTDVEKLNWVVNLYCPGSISTSTERVKDRDGSVSTETNRNTSLSWDQSIGFIIHNQDTLGRFGVVRMPRDCPDLDNWKGEVYSKKLKKFTEMMWSGYEFALWGEFRKKEFLIILNAESNQLFLYKELELSGIFEPERADLLVSKKNRKKTTLLVNPHLEQEAKSDVLLLSMTGLWMMGYCGVPR